MWGPVGGDGYALIKSVDGERIRRGFDSRPSRYYGGIMLIIKPIDFLTAQRFVAANHRHNKPPVGHKFSIACYEGERLCGVCMVGRPVSRYLDDGLTLEVNRCCTDGTKNACSKLYGAAQRAARALGYKRIFTYTREDENGSSLRAAN